MKHHKRQRKLGRKSKQRSALLRSLAQALIKYESIKTTEAKAKEVRPFVEKLITNARVGDHSHNRLVASRLGGDPALAKKLIAEIAPQYKDRQGGYTRITKLPIRRSDAAKMAQIELVK